MAGKQVVDSTCPIVRCILSKHPADSLNRIYDFSFGLPDGKFNLNFTQTFQGINAVYLLRSLEKVLISAVIKIKPNHLIIVSKEQDERKFELFKSVAGGVARRGGFIMTTPSVEETGAPSSMKVVVLKSKDALNFSYKDLAI